MSDSLLFISIYLGLLLGILLKGLPRNPIDNLLIHLSTHWRHHQKQIHTQDRRYVVQLVQDNTLFIMATMKAVTLAILFFLIFIIFWILPLRPFGLFTDLATLFTGFGSLWIGNRAFKQLHLLQQAYQLYQEEKEIEAEIDPHQDETAYLLRSPANAERLRRALREYETGQHIRIDLDE